MRSLNQLKRKGGRALSLGLGVMVFLAAAPVASGGEAEQAFFNANRLYEQGDYSGAIAEYEKVLDMGLESGNLYYNLGNAYFKEDKVAEAILSYRRALDLLPRDGDLESNLGYAELSIKDRFSSPRGSFFARLLDRFSSQMTVSELAILSSSVLALFWAAAIAALFLVRLRERLKKLAVAFLVLFLLAVSLTGYRLYGEAVNREGVIMVERVEVRYSPAENGTVAFNLHKGSTVRIIRRRNGWVQVGIPGDKSGWIEAAAIQPVSREFVGKSKYHFKVMETGSAPSGSTAEK